MNNFKVINFRYWRMCYILLCNP